MVKFASALLAWLVLALPAEAQRFVVVESGSPDYAPGRELRSGEIVRLRTAERLVVIDERGRTLEVFGWYEASIDDEAARRANRAALDESTAARRRDTLWADDPGFGEDEETAAAARSRLDGGGRARLRRGGAVDLSRRGEDDDGFAGAFEGRAPSGGGGTPDPNAQARADGSGRGGRAERERLEDRAERGGAERGGAEREGAAREGGERDGGERDVSRPEARGFDSPRGVATGGDSGVIVPADEVASEEVVVEDEVTVVGDSIRPVRSGRKAAARGNAGTAGAKRAEAKRAGAKRAGGTRTEGRRGGAERDRARSGPGKGAHGRGGRSGRSDGRRGDGESGGATSRGGGGAVGSGGGFGPDAAEGRGL